MTGTTLTPANWRVREDPITIHEAVTKSGSIEIRDQDESVMCTRSDRTWPLFRWEAHGDGVVVTGTARSLGRAKEDALAALRMLSVYNFETSTPRDEERLTGIADQVTLSGQIASGEERTDG